MKKEISKYNHNDIPETYLFLRLKDDPQYFLHPFHENGELCGVEVKKGTVGAMVLPNEKEAQKVIDDLGATNVETINVKKYLLESEQAKNN